MSFDWSFIESSKEQLQSISTHIVSGYIQQVIGLTIESSGLAVTIGELCQIYNNMGQPVILAEVVGFKKNRSLLMPLGEMAGIGPGCKVVALRQSLQVAVGDELLGRIIDGLGQPLDVDGAISKDSDYPINNTAPHPLTRPRISKPLSIGVRAIDGFLTCGKGQRLGIFAGSGVGKSTLLGMIARNSSADVNVIALIGERGREVREFIEKDLGAEGLKRSVVIVATSDQPPLIRLKGAFVATAIAEYFRDKGKDVLLMMDSVTRFALAQREIGLAVGEPPVTRGYTPSVFALLPKLLERSGMSPRGSITAFYTVLVDGDDLNEPITDAVRGILDGHIVLSRRLANSGIYPAIDLLGSISRVMENIVSKEHVRIAREGKRYLAVYRESEDLINIGAYEDGSNPEIDKARDVYARLRRFLQQGVDEKSQLQDVLPMLRKVLLEGASK